MSAEELPDQPPELPDQESAQKVSNYLTYTLSLPERALRSTASLAGGAAREAAAMLVPAAFQDSKTYSILVRQTLDFLVEDVGGVARDADAEEDDKIEGFVARKAVGNFVEMAGMATMHVSPMLMLALVSDIAYGSQSYLREYAEELKREGVIDESSTIYHANDLLEAVKDASSSAASTFDTPPLSVEGLRASIQQTQQAAQRIDPTDALPLSEIQRMWKDMEQIAADENVSMFEVSSAMTLYSLDRVATLGRGALSGARVAGTIFDRHIIDHYRGALNEIHEKGYYQTLAEASGPYIEAVWKNFSTDRGTITEDLLSGKLIGKAATGIKRLFTKEDDPPPPRANLPAD